MRKYLDQAAEVLRSWIQESQNSEQAAIRDSEDETCPTCTATPYDTVVVGGGISGLYSAWRIKQHYPQSSVALLESSSRLGGRILSLQLPGLPDVAADLGAMHYLEDYTSVQSYLIRTVLNITSIDFPTNSSDPRLPFVLRGRRFTAAQLSNVTEVSSVYALSAAEKALYTGPGSLYEYYVHKLVPSYDNITVDPWKEKTSDGRFLKDLGWLELAMLAGMSDEAMHLIIDSSGFADFWDNPNAAALKVQHTTFLHASEYKTFAGGMEDIVRKFADMTKYIGVDVYVNTPVSGLVNCGEHEKVLSASRAFCAKQVILALPRPALEPIDWVGLRVNPAWQSVTPVHAMKLYLGYDAPWWRKPPVQSKSGWLYTNLPIQQVLYLGSQADHPTQTNKNNTNSLLMAMYCTEQFTTIWESLSRANASLEGFHGRPNLFTGNTEPPIVENVGRPVSMEMLRLVRQQLAMMHGMAVEDVPEPYTAALVDWPAAWHWWKPGANASELSSNVAKLLFEEEVYIVGEAYSNLQGWIQGALSMTEQVLQKKLGLPPPPGLPPITTGPQPNLWHELRFGRRFQSSSK
ncbi:L-amino-acid oxidase-like [Sycon ciliatum]|uniref:L-amino-acid oxidase-like n=1 Tax=Sycon ciliatum TaxID=27933 RepID=UPI0031F66D70